MAFSREDAFKRWIKKLKQRQKTLMDTGDSYTSNRVEDRIKREMKDHTSG